MTQTLPNPSEQSQIDHMQDRLDFAKNLQALTNKIHGTDNIAQIMLDLSSEISDLFRCERLTLYVYSKERGALVSKVKTGIDVGKDLVLPVNRQSIAGYVAATRKSVRIDNLDDAEELKRIDRELHFFNQVDHIVLAGGCAVIPGLAETVSGRTQVDTHIANPFARMSLGTKIRPKSLSADAPALLVACGLALRRFDS